VQANAAPVEHGASSDTAGLKYTSNDIAHSGDGDCARASALPVGVSPSPAAGVDDVVTGEPAEHSAPAVTDQHADARRAENPSARPAVMTRATWA
jgi:hypothetical protein